MDLSEALDAAMELGVSVPSAWIAASPGTQLRMTRNFRGISQRHLADAAGVAQSVVCRLERGADARWETWRRLYAALGFDVSMIPRPASEDAIDVLEDEAHSRARRAEDGRLARWG